MTLLELKKYLQERKTVSLDELCMHFRTTPQAAEPLLDQWIRKGSVQREVMGSCGETPDHCSCSGGGTHHVLYTWLSHDTP